MKIRHNKTPTKKTKIHSLSGQIVAIDFRRGRGGGWQMSPPRAASDEELAGADIPALLSGEGCWLADRTHEAGAFRRKHNIPSILWK